MTDLGIVGGAFAINERGQIIGGSEGSPVIWQNGIMTPLPMTLVAAINERGQIVGVAVTDSPAYERSCVLWENGVVTDLGTLGGRSCWAALINERGQIVGYSDTASDGSHPFIWENGVMTQLPEIEGAYATLLDINDLGQVVGIADCPFTCDPFVVLWER